MRVLKCYGNDLTRVREEGLVNTAFQGNVRPGLGQDLLQAFGAQVEVIIQRDVASSGIGVECGARVQSCRASGLAGKWELFI